MAWVRLDDGFAEHEKIADLSDRAFRLHVTALCYCGRNLTDGRLSVRAVRVVSAIIGPGNAARWTRELVAAGLWSEIEGGYEINDFLQYNPSSDDVKERRDYAKRKQDLSRNQQLRDDIKRRDGDRCRYCGRVVNWTDRKGPGGATYDHVDPWGDNSLENVVVACRGCNSGKGQRTPAGARMRLLDPPVSGTESSTGLESVLEQDQTGTSLPFPSHPLGVSSKDESPTRDASGARFKQPAIVRLHAACGGGQDALRKLERTVRANKLNEGDVEYAIECATGPGVRDALSVALSELKKRGDRRAA